MQPVRFVLSLLILSLPWGGCQSTPTVMVEPVDRASLTATPEPTRTYKPVRLPATSTVKPPSPTALPPTRPVTPSPTPSSTLLAFEAHRDGNSEIYLLEPRSGQLTNVTRHPAHDRSPAWRPDGEALAFASRRDGNWDIYLLSLADASVERLTDSPAYDGAPAWSPDGTQIAFESYRDGNLEIYVMTVASRELFRLSDDPGGDYGPAWRPDGTAVAFTSWRDGDKEIYLAPALGGQAQNLTLNPADDEDPVWTADGSALAFVSWRDVDPLTGNRNAEIYSLFFDDGTMERLTDSLWPDLDPSWDSEGELVWSAYDPGPAFETYDPYRPGNYHLYRRGIEGVQRLTDGAADDRHPAPAPRRSISLDALTAEPLSTTLVHTPASTELPQGLVEVVQVPGILASFSGEPISVNEVVAPSLLAWQQELVKASGWDLLGMTLGSWRPIDSVRKRELYVYDYGYLSWHKAGRAVDLALEYKVDGADQMLLVREDLGGSTYWRMYLRTARQDGTLGEPLKENPWRYWWHIAAGQEPEAYAAGGKRLPIPPGYYADVTSIARRHGWNRIASYAIDGDYHWHTDSNGTEYWHYERADGLTWWEAMQQIYQSETLEQYVGWSAGLQHSQSESMMRSKGVATPTPTP